MIVVGIGASPQLKSIERAQGQGDTGAGKALMDTSTQQRIDRWINVALFGALAIEFCLFVDQLMTQHQARSYTSVHNVAHILSFSLLVLLAVLRCFHQAGLSVRETNSLCQTDALAGLVTTVKHELNNDMQVIVGNAELAEVKISTGADISKPISQIAKAASAAIVRIDQLSALGSTLKVAKDLVDGNALLRQVAAVFAVKLHSGITIRLELDRLPRRVKLDSHLFTLSLEKLIQSAAVSMKTSDEIVLRTVYSSEAQAGQADVNMDFIFVSQSLSKDEQTMTSMPARLPFENNLRKSSELMELSGAISVRYECSSYGAQISMQFVSDTAFGKASRFSNLTRET